MLNTKTALKINTFVLFLIGVIDIIRGFMHTYNIRWASANIAKIEPIPDSLLLMGAFGISNFLTAFVYFLICWKAKHLSPYVLLLIPFSYMLGFIGLKVENVTPNAEFNGQYMMMVYLGICTVVAIYYFVLSGFKKV